MPFLYEKIDTLREVGVQKELPQYMQENLNRNFELRPYQIKAFENFITYFENDKLCQKPPSLNAPDAIFLAISQYVESSQKYI